MSPFVRKLRHGSRLTAEDEAVLDSLSGPARRAERGDIAPEGSEPRGVVLVLEGWICRYKQLENGKRQITSVYLPGDLCEPFGALPPVMDHSLAALTPARLARLPLGALRGAARANPRIEQALWWDLLSSDAMRREHVVSLGRRSATERLGHFFCEMHSRLGVVGLADQSSCDIPVLQADLADLLGISTVHVNRSLGDLRGSGLLSLRGRRLTIHDMQALQELSMFEPGCLAAGNAELVPAFTGPALARNGQRNKHDA